jgi:hypothetical protein
MPQNAIHNPWLSYNGDNLHLGGTGTEHGMDLCSLDRFFEARQAARQHGFARSRRANQDNVIDSLSSIPWLLEVG